MFTKHDFLIEMFVGSAGVKKSGVYSFLSVLFHWLTTVC